MSRNTVDERGSRGERFILFRGRGYSRSSRLSSLRRRSPRLGRHLLLAHVHPPIEEPSGFVHQDVAVRGHDLHGIGAHALRLRVDRRAPAHAPVTVRDLDVGRIVGGHLLVLGLRRGRRNIVHRSLRGAAKVTAAEHLAVLLDLLERAARPLDLVHRDVHRALVLGRGRRSCNCRRCCRDLRDPPGIRDGHHAAVRQGDPGVPVRSRRHLPAVRRGHGLRGLVRWRLWLLGLLLRDCLRPGLLRRPCRILHQADLPVRQHRPEHAVRGVGEIGQGVGPSLRGGVLLGRLWLRFALSFSLPGRLRWRIGGSLR